MSSSSDKLPHILLGAKVFLKSKSMKVLSRFLCELCPQSQAGFRAPAPLSCHNPPWQGEALPCGKPTHSPWPSPRDSVQPANQGSAPSTCMTEASSVAAGSAFSLPQGQERSFPRSPPPPLAQTGEESFHLCIPGAPFVGISLGGTNLFLTAVLPGEQPGPSSPFDRWGN